MIYLPFLLILAVGSVWVFATLPKGRRIEQLLSPYRRRPIVNTLGTLAALMVLYMLTNGFRQLAQIFYATAEPTGEQLKNSQLLVAASILLPAVVALALTLWRRRFAEKSTRNSPPLYDETNRLVLKREGSTRDASTSETSL